MPDRESTQGQPAAGPQADTTAQVSQASAGTADQAESAAKAAALAAARARMVAALRDSRRALSPLIQDAFAQVPRHVFVPELPSAAAYQDEAFVIKWDADGVPVSSSSQPAMMAIMLEQLMLGRGQRVLEIGTGTGYNAAVLAHIVGDSGHVSTVDIDPELVQRAQASLTAAGYGSVEVSCADGGYGQPEAAPFDRIIVTAGAWDIPPAWLEQLAGDGRVVLPLAIRGLQLSVALKRSGQYWQSTSACRCGFVRVAGAFAGPESTAAIGPAPELFVQVADGRPADAEAVQRALAEPPFEVPAAVQVADVAELGDLDLWLTLTEPGLDRLTLFSSGPGRAPAAPLVPMGGLASEPSSADRLGIAVLMPASGGAGPPRLGRAGLAIAVSGYGPGGPALAAHLAQQALAWHDAGRPGVADLRLTVRPGRRSRIRPDSWKSSGRTWASRLAGLASRVQAQAAGRARPLALG
jgi:protein-L-isoaspartate(D-aspartate) O-methyltransferase